MSTLPPDLPESTPRLFRTRIGVWMRLLAPQIIARVVADAVRDHFFD